MSKNQEPLSTSVSLKRIGVEPSTNTDPGGDVEASAAVPSKKSSRKRRYAIRCCACCGISVVILGIVILILALTVFTVKDPRMTMNSLTYNSSDIGFFQQQDRMFSLNTTLTADISIKNPNAASFRFRNSTTLFYYNGTMVGSADAPSGNARARRTVRFNATVDVFAERVSAIAMANFNETLGLIFGNPVTFNLSSFTAIRGRVDLWGLYRKNLEIKMNCSMTLEYPSSDQILKNKDCRAEVS